MFMIALMTIYLLVISRLIDAFFSSNIVIELICYLVAGIVWIFPAKWLMFKINGNKQSGKE